MKQLVISLDEYRTACLHEYCNWKLRKELISLKVKEIKFDYFKQEVTIYYET